jgi:D-xylose transport system substrate-binding protein
MVKSKKLLAFFLVMILTLSVVLAGCTSSKTNETTNTTSSNASSNTETKKIKIGFSLPTMREERYQRDRDAFVEEAETWSRSFSTRCK